MAKVGVTWKVSMVRILKKVFRRLAVRRQNGSFFMSENAEYSAFEIGAFTYGFPKIFPEQGVTLKIGKFCSFAENVVIILGGEHNTQWVSTFPFNQVWAEVKARGAKLDPIWQDASRFTGHPRSNGDVSIGNDVWVARNVTILSGVTIGDGAVIGAGSIVRRNVLPYSIVAGNPAVFIRRRFSLDQIESLQRIAWWNWPIERVMEALPLLLASNVNDFILRYSAKE